MLSRIFIFGAGVAASVGGVSHAVTLVNDDFTSAERVGMPNAWTGVDRDGGTSNDYVVATNGNADMATGAVNDRASNVGTGINGNSFFVSNVANAYSVLTHFTPTALVAGSPITFSFNIRTTADVTAAGGAFRFGLFNSAGSLQTANTSSFSNNGGFNGYNGYIASHDTTATGLTGRIQQRGATTGTNLFGNAFGAGTNVSNTNSILANTTYAAVLTLSRSSDGNSVTVNSSFNGIAATNTYTGAIFTTFDTASVFFGSPFGNSTTPAQNFIDDVVVTVIPEPSSALLAFLGLIGLMRRRR